MHPSLPASRASDAPLSILWRIMSGHRLLYGGAVAALLFANLLAYLAPLIGSATLDLAISGRQTADVPEVSRRIVGLLGGVENLSAHLWLGAVAMAILTAASGCFAYLKGWLAALASDGIARRIKNRLYNHLQHLPIRYHDTADTGDLVQRCTSDVETIRMCLSAQVVEIGNAAVLIATALPVMLLLSPTMTWLSLALLLPIIVFGFVYFRRVKHLFRDADEAEGRLTSVVQENLNGIRVVRAFARQDFENKRFATPNADYRDRSLSMIRSMAWYWSTSDLVCLAQNGLVLFGGIRLVAQGEITVGTLFAFLTFLNILLWPVRQMGRILTDLGKTTVSLGRLGEILDARDEDPVTAIDGVSEETPATVSGRIEFHNVVFSHNRANDGRPRPPAAASASTVPDAVPATNPPRHALDGVSFDIHPGETIAILGPSGSGKSTLISLLLRLFDAQGGVVALDGRDIRTLDRKWIRAQFGVVMQEPFLYSKTLSENIRFGRGSADEHEIAEAARMAAIHDTITTFEQGYGTLIGERGITLSGGQRQRVAIARALLRNPPILIFDDALSAVDSETEVAIIDALRRRHGKLTTILIAHRLSTLAHADRIVVLEHGRVTQIGRHQQLVARDGLYRRLWAIQTELDFETNQTTSASAEEVVSRQGAV
ncbi:MAG: ABC transporter ATP-binding protein [Opitutaceae bacterium]